MSDPVMITRDWVWPAPVIRIAGKPYRPVVSSEWINEFTRAQGGHAGSDITYPVGKKELPQYVPPRDRSSGMGFFYPPGIPVLCCHDGVVASAAETSRGIGVEISHTGTGFRTFYQHLETLDARVRKGVKLKAGAHLGTAGYDPSGNQVRHIHFELSYWTGVKWQKIDPGTHRRGIMSLWSLWTGVAYENYQDYGRPGSVGRAEIETSAINSTQALDRSTFMQNQRGADFKRAQATYYGNASQSVAAVQSQVYAAMASAQGKPPEVENPMAFDFTTGLWTDGKAV